MTFSDCIARLRPILPMYMQRQKGHTTNSLHAGAHACLHWCTSHDCSILWQHAPAFHFTKQNQCPKVSCILL